MGRFEGFESSGKMGYIEDTELQNDIMDLYQENIPALNWGADYYNAMKIRLREYCYANAKRDAATGMGLYDGFNTDQGYYWAADLSYTDEIIGRYNNCIKKSEKIIAGINRIYDLK